MLVILKFFEFYNYLYVTNTIFGSILQ